MGYVQPAEVRFQAGARDLSLLHSVQTGSGAHPASIQWVPGALYPGAKRPGREETDYSPSSSAEVKNGGAIPPLPNTTSWRGA
jgi:hypothetical protein